MRDDSLETRCTDRSALAPLSRRTQRSSDAPTIVEPGAAGKGSVGIVPWQEGFRTRFERLDSTGKREREGQGKHRRRLEDRDREDVEIRFAMCQARVRQERD